MYETGLDVDKLAHSIQGISLGDKNKTCHPDIPCPLQPMDDVIEVDITRHPSRALTLGGDNMLRRRVPNAILPSPAREDENKCEESQDNDHSMCTSSEPLSLRRSGVACAGIGTEFRSVFRAALLPLFLFFVIESRYVSDVARPLFRQAEAVLDFSIALAQAIALRGLFSCRLWNNTSYHSYSQNNQCLPSVRGFRGLQKLNARASYIKISAVNNVVLRLCIWLVLTIARCMTFFVCVALFISNSGLYKRFPIGLKSALSSFLSRVVMWLIGRNTENLQSRSFSGNV